MVLLTLPYKDIIAAGKMAKCKKDGYSISNRGLCYLLRPRINVMILSSVRVAGIEME
jgi:hypothetical protein